jgi:bacterioferritin
LSIAGEPQASGRERRQARVWFCPFGGSALVGTMRRSHSLKGNLEMEQVQVIDRKTMIGLLNEDLAREYQAIIAYVNYSQVIKGAQYMDIARELEKHAGEELDHAIKISNQIDYLGGMPTVVPKPVKTSEKSEEMLRFDLENERVTIVNYRTRIRQADAMGEFALSEVLREIIVQEQEHLMDLANALGIDAPDVSVSAG